MTFFTKTIIIAFSIMVVAITITHAGRMFFREINKRAGQPKQQHGVVIFSSIAISVMPRSVLNDICPEMVKICFFEHELYVHTCVLSYILDNI